MKIHHGQVVRTHDRLECHQGSRINASASTNQFVSEAEKLSNNRDFIMRNECAVELALYLGGTYFFAKLFYHTT